MFFRGRLVWRKRMVFRRNSRISSYFCFSSFRRRYLKTRSSSYFEKNKRFSLAYYIRFHSLWSSWLSWRYDSVNKLRMISINSSWYLFLIFCIWMFQMNSMFFWYGIFWVFDIILFLINFFLWIVFLGSCCVFLCGDKVNRVLFSVRFDVNKFIDSDTERVPLFCSTRNNLRRQWSGSNEGRLKLENGEGL